MTNIQFTQKYKFRRILIYCQNCNNDYKNYIVSDTLDETIKSRYLTKSKIIKKKTNSLKIFMIN